jgi:alpha-1,2-mannosyltransferase
MRPQGSLHASVVAVAARISTVLLFGVAPAALLLYILAASGENLAVDLHRSFRPAAEAVLAGQSPYPPPTAESMAERDAFVYLPFAALVFTPFALLPPLAADVVMLVIVTALGAAALWILGVRDWRCYGAAAAMPAVVSAVQTANLTLPFVLALAAAWALRSRTVLPGVVLALTLATKLFLWPVLVWWLATGRHRTALVAAGTTVFLVVGSWSLLGFAGVTDYPALLHVLTASLGGDSYTAFALASDLGVGELPARLLSLAVASAALAGCVLLGRRGDEVRSFALAVLAALLFSPIVWLHYFALLLVPIAIAHRRLSYLWLLPVALWEFAEHLGNGTTAQTALTLAAVLATLGLAVRASPAGPLASLSRTRRALNGSLATGSTNA